MTEEDDYTRWLNQMKDILIEASDDPEGYWKSSLWTLYFDLDAKYKADVAKDERW